MEFKWPMIAVCVIFVAVSVTSIFTHRAKAEVTVACYQAQAEAMRQHVEFKDTCN